MKILNEIQSNRLTIELHCTELRMSNVIEKPRQTYRSLMRTRLKNLCVPLYVMYVLHKSKFYRLIFSLTDLFRLQ